MICTVCLDNPPIDEGELADAIAAEIEKRGAICVKRLEIDDEEEVDDE